MYNLICKSGTKWIKRTYSDWGKQRRLFVVGVYICGHIELKVIYQISDAHIGEVATCEDKDAYPHYKIWLGLLVANQFGQSVGCRRCSAFFEVFFQSLFGLLFNVPVCQHRFNFIKI